MLKGKLVTLLSSFEEASLKRLEKYIQSPFFNKSKKIIHLFELLKKAHPFYEKINKETLFKKVFPEKTTYNDALLRALMAELGKLVEGFIEFSEYEQQKGQRAVNLLNGLLRRELHSIFKKEGAAILKRQEQELFKDSNYFLQNFQLEKLHYQFITVTNHRAVESHLQEAIHHFDAYYINTKLRLTWIALNRQQVVGQPYELGFLVEELLEQIPQALLDKYPITNANYQLVLLLKDSEQLHYFHNLKAHLAAHISAFSKDELRQLYIILINYCARKFRAGQHHFVQEALELYKTMLATGLLYVNSYIWYQNFVNIVNIGIAAGAFEWTKQFIEQYKKDLHPNYQVYVSLFNMANLHFSQRNFDTTLEALRNLQFSNFNFDNIDYTHYLNYKTLLIQTYYELEEWLSIEPTLEAFRMYLRKNKAVTPHKRKAYGNFIKLTKKLVNKRLGKKRTAKNLLSDIQKVPFVMARPWLLKKAEEVS